MSDNKNLQPKSIEDNGLDHTLGGMVNNGLNFNDDIYLNLERPGLAEFFQFFLTDFESLPMSDNEKHYATLYYFYKNAYKKLPTIVAKSDRGKEINLRDFLFEVFFETWDSRIQKIPDCVNKNPESLAELIDWEMIKKEFPLAKKSNYHLLQSKTFLEDVKKKFLSDFCSKNPDFHESIKNQAKDIKDIRVLYTEFIETLVNMETSSNLIEVYVKDYLLFNLFNRFYLDNQKKKNRLDSKSGKIEISSEEKNKIFQKLMNTDEIDQISNINLLNEEEKNTIDSIVQKFDSLSEKDKKKLKRYLVRLAIKKKPFKVNQFLKNNNLKELPEGVIGLLDDLMIDIIEDGDENTVTSPEQTNEINNNLVDNQEVASIDALTEGLNKEIFEIFQKDPVSAVMKKAEVCNYGIENENLLRKQVETSCLSSKFTKNSLLISLLKDTFSKPIQKRSGVYSLRAGGSGYRFVLKQDEKGKFIIVGFYNHDDYEKVLDGRMG